MVHRSGKFGSPKIFFTIRNTNKVKLIERFGTSSHCCVFILGFFKQAVNKVLNIIMQVSFHPSN